MTDQDSETGAARAAARRRTETESVAAIMRETYKPSLLSVKGQDGGAATQILILPDGHGGLAARGVKEFLDPYRAAPERREGTARLTALDSLIALVNRFKDADSALFANDAPAAAAIEAVLDYHKAGADGGPRFGKHRAWYEFPLSDEWLAWRKAEGAPMAQMEFAEFLEDRIVDVMAPPTSLIMDPNATGAAAEDDEADARLRDLVAKIGGKVGGPGRLMELSRGLRIADKQVAKTIVNPSSGEMNIQFESEHQDAEGKPIAVPNLFLLAIPVFRHGPLYRVSVRLRYRLRAGEITWTVTMHRADLVWDHAFGEACERVAAETGCPLFIGRPER